MKKRILALLVLALPSLACNVQCAIGRDISQIIQTDPLAGLVAALIAGAILMAAIAYLFSNGGRGLGSGGGE